jgi:hypothetical protein
MAKTAWLHRQGRSLESSVRRIRTSESRVSRRQGLRLGCDLLRYLLISVHIPCNLLLRSARRNSLHERTKLARCQLSR